LCDENSEKISNNIEPQVKTIGSDGVKTPLTSVIESETNNSKVNKLLAPTEQNIPANKNRNVTGVLSNGMVSKLTATTRPGNVNVLTCKPSQQMPGHTGYLTFASLYPSILNREE